MAFSPDGKRLASAAGDRTVKVWDAQTGQELLTFKGTLASTAWPSARTASVWPAVLRTRRVKVWDAETGQELLTFKGTRHVTAWPSARTANAWPAALR